MELRLHPTVEILSGEWHVSEVLSAVEAGEKWVAAAQERTAVIVWRQGTRVRYASFKMRRRRQ
jgi:antitoxin (DNA-binding transcriptional repressor) of toxin-antitoxin stability system